MKRKLTHKKYSNKTNNNNNNTNKKKKSITEIQKTTFQSEVRKLTEKYEILSNQKSKKKFPMDLMTRSDVDLLDILITNLESLLSKRLFKLIDAITTRKTTFSAGKKFDRIRDSLSAARVLLQRYYHMKLHAIPFKSKYYSLISTIKKHRNKTKESFEKFQIHLTEQFEHDPIKTYAKNTFMSGGYTKGLVDYCDYCDLKNLSEKLCGIATQIK